MCIVLFLNSFKQMEFERDALLERKMKEKKSLLKYISILEQQGGRWNVQLYWYLGLFMWKLRKPVFV